MTVRWKPLIVISGLFFVVAVLGLLMVVIALPKSSGDIMTLAREHWKEGRFDHAEVQFRRALQVDGKNAKIHSEMAKLYEAWAAQEPSKRGLLRVKRLHELGEVAKYDKRDLDSRRALLADALQHDDPSEAYANDVIAIDPEDTDAHFALASELLKAPTLDRAALTKHLDVLDAREGERPRTAWIRARLAKDEADAAKVSEILTASRSMSLEKADPTDQSALLRLRQMDVLASNDPASIALRVEALKECADAVAANGAVPPERLSSLGASIQEVQAHLDRLAVGASEADRAAMAATSTTLDKIAESTFTKAVEVSKAVDLNVYPDYAEHMLLRNQPEQCLAIVKEALANPLASQAVWATTAARLREIGIKAALSDGKNPKRFEIAAPYVKEMLQSPTARYQALGNLFQGVIELEQSGLVEASTGVAPADGQAAIDAKHRVAALEHLRLAAAGLQDVATAQALYGVSLLMSKELALGRQYLQNARSLPNLEPRYQVWTAWATVQAGYPEDAEPIVTSLLAGLADGRTPPQLEPTLRLLSAEIHQARRTPEELRLAREDYQKALASPEIDSPALRLRLAQIDLMLGEKGTADEAIASLRKSGAGGAAAEHLAVLTLADGDKPAEARKAIDQARAKYPDSEELAGLDAALHIRAGQPAKADAALAAFLKTHPNSPDVIQMRARVLANSLNKVDEARALLAPLAETSETSGPLVQLALLDLNRNNFAAMEKTIARIRQRWAEASAGDLLDAQLALAKGKTHDATVFLDSALKKDPGNKVALFWKAQLDDRTGATKQAKDAYQEILKNRPNKELDEGLSLTTAADWALATLALENQEPDDAIARFEALLRADNGKLDRPIRWQLATAHSAKGDWTTAKSEIAALLKDPKSTPIERVRAANFYRQHGDIAGASRELDVVLKADPGNSPAVAMQGFLLAQSNPVEAAALVRRAIDAAPQPDSIYLMLSAIENLVPPAADASTRALAVLDSALGKYPDSIALIAARYRVLKMKDGDKPALAYLKERVKNDPKGDVHRFLVDVYRDAGQYTDAEATLRELIALQPQDEGLAAMLVRLVALQAIDAASKGDRTAEATLNDKTARLIREDRDKFPKDLTFIQAECELAARRGKYNEAVSLSAEIDALDANSPIGPVLRAEIAKAQGATQTMAEQYTEAVNRAPRRPDLRLALGEASLALGKTDEALKQAEWLLDSQANLANAAVLLKARALSTRQGTSAEVEAGRDEAIRSLNDAIKAQPKFTPAYHLLAEIYQRSGRRADALKVLKADLAQVKDDNAGLSMLVQTLTETQPGGPAPSQADRQDAINWAENLAAGDKTGQLALALAIGFHKAGQYDLALPWAEKAVAKLDSWLAHLNFGDLLLSKAESTSDKAAAQALFEKAANEYDLVLKTNANSIEAVNNKAWILHEYLGRDGDALLLAEEFQKRANPAILPPDFLDTLGAIQEAMNKTSEAERSYAAGLEKSPEHPILNFHMGRLLSQQPNQAESALEHLKKAQAARASMPPSMSTEVDALVKQLESNTVFPNR